MIINEKVRRLLILLVCVSMLTSVVACTTADAGDQSSESDTVNITDVIETDEVTETVDEQQLSFYDKYYVDPKTVSITAEGKTKNLIYIYLESMETTYASVEIGGKQEDGNYIPGLTALAEEGITFTDKEEGELGGFMPITGIKWTMAGLLATTSGLHFAFPVDSNDMSDYYEFAPNITTLGDILEERGYFQKFLCGSDAVFGGRKNYFQQHGNYKIFDLYTAREKGYIPKDYKVWWGYEDAILFEIAKDEATKMAERGQPFNLTLLTVDTHHVDGYLCNECDRSVYDTTTSDGRLKTVLTCSDKLVCAFVEWCKQQDFYEDTVIVISGDHPRMDSTLIHGTAYKDRTIYNCILNSAVEPAEGATVKRKFIAQDMFPTTLAAMGFTIEGNRLALGTNMFSGEKTLTETEGYFYLQAIFAKRNQTYADLTGFDPDTKIK